MMKIMVGLQVFVFFVILKVILEVFVFRFKFVINLIILVFVINYEYFIGFQQVLGCNLVFVYYCRIKYICI